MLYKISHEQIQEIIAVIQEFPLKHGFKVINMIMNLPKIEETKKEKKEENLSDKS